jgi:hypothetical protein
MGGRPASPGGVVTIDFDQEHYVPIYESDVATDGVLILPDSAASEYALRVIDKTAGVVVNEAAGAGGRIAVETIRPVARIRHRELTDAEPDGRGLAVTDLEGAQLTITHDDQPAVTWGIRSYQVKPSPSGPGEIELILTDRED